MMLGSILEKNKAERYAEMDKSSLGYYQDFQKAVKIPGENAKRRTVVESSQPFEAHNFPAPEDHMLFF
jgi:hypothetical protein